MKDCSMATRRGGWLPVAVAVAVAALAAGPLAGEISFNQDFDSGSLNIAETTVEKAETDQPVITLAPRDILSTGRWYHFDLSGVEGKQPVFRVPAVRDANRAHLADHRYVFSLDGGRTHAYFKNGDRDGDWFVFRADEPFSQDTVRIAYSLPYPVSRTVEHTSSLFGSRWVSPIPGSARQFVVDFTPGTENGGYRDDLEREIPRLPIIGFRITDPAVDHGDKLRVVLTSGTHASETTGNFVLEGKINFLVSDDPAAAELRRMAVIDVYPQVNPEGRWAGYMRSAPEAPRVNVNRDWHDDPQNTPVKILTEFIPKAVGGSAAVVIDYHSHRSGEMEIWDGRENGNERPYFRFLKDLHPPLRFLHWRVNGSVSTWARENLDTVESFIVETGFLAGWQPEDYHDFGRNNGLALLEVLREIKKD